MQAGILDYVSMVTVFCLMLWYYYRNMQDHPSTFFWILQASLFLLTVATSMPQPTTIHLRIINTLSSHQALLSAYFGYRIQISKKDRLLFEQKKLYFLKDKRYIAITLLSFMVVIMFILEPDNVGMFINGEAYEPTSIYFLAHLLNYGLWLYLAYLIMVNCKKTYENGYGFVLLAHKYLGMFLWVAIIVAVMIININLLSSMLIGDMYRSKLNTVYHIIKIIIGIMLLLYVPFYIRSLPILKLGISLFQRFQGRNIRYLHHTMRSIVTISDVPDTRDLHTISIEIEDLRDSLWSHEARIEPITVADEVELLLQHLRHGKQEATIGPYIAPPTALELTTHNIHVGRQLKKTIRRQRLRSWVFPRKDL